MPHPVYTFGYGNRTSLEPLLAQLQAYGIKRVIDVRESPKGWSVIWSRPNLAKQLADWGYESLPALGNTIRNETWVPPDGAEAEWALRRVAGYLDDGPLLLLCAEKDYRRCHRTPVAERLTALVPTEIVHLD